MFVMETKMMKARELKHSWDTDPRWKGITRNYTPEEVLGLRGSFKVHHTLADMGARRLWDLMHREEYVHALGAMSGNQAVQQVRAGLEAIYLSGWQVAADANLSGEMYPDQSLYPANSVPFVVQKINRALLRADQIEHAEGKVHHHWMVPIVADAEAGFGGPLNAYEKMRTLRRESIGSNFTIYSYINCRPFSGRCYGYSDIIDCKN
jgi:isocitrate lyase